MTFQTTCRVRVRVGHFIIPPTRNVAPSNEKLDLGIFQHSEQLLGLGLGWCISSYPNQECHTQNKKLYLGILQHSEQLLGLGLGWAISSYLQPGMSH